MLTKDQSEATNPVISHDNHSGSEVTTGPDKEDTGSYFIITICLCRKISIVFPNDANQEVQEDLFTTEVTIAYELLAADITLRFIGHHS